MVTNFEQYTQPLSEREEKLILPCLLDVICNRAYDKDHWISSKNLIREVEQEYHKRTNGEFLSLADSRLRAMVNYAVCKQMLPIGSGTGGYWVISSEEEFDSNMESLRNRSNALLAREHGLSQMKKLKYGK